MKYIGTCLGYTTKVVVTYSATIYVLQYLIYLFAEMGVRLLFVLKKGGIFPWTRNLVIFQYEEFGDFRSGFRVLVIWLSNLNSDISDKQDMTPTVVIFLHVNHVQLSRFYLD